MPVLGMHNLYKICAPGTVIYYESDFKSFPTLKCRTHKLVEVLFLKRDGFDISLYRAP